MTSQLDDDGSGVSRRKSSWSNYLNRVDAEPSERSHYPSMKKLNLPSPQQLAGRHQYNIEDFLPKPYKTGTYASVDIVELDDDLNPPFMTARFPEIEKELKPKTSTAVESELQKEWKEQKAEIERLKEAVEKIEKSKPVRKMLGWSQRIEIKVNSTPKRTIVMEHKATETDELPQQKHVMPSIQIQTEAIVTRPQPKTTRQTMSSHFHQDAVETVSRHQPIKPLLLEKDSNIPLLPIRSETAREPLKRIRKQYTELYAIRVDQINDTVMALLRYQND